MKSLIFAIGGFTAATAGFLIWKNLHTSHIYVPVDQLAHRLEEAWADHHTVA